MKNIKIILGILVLVIVIGFSFPLGAITVSPTGTHFFGDVLTFAPSNAAFSSAITSTWDFGDGSPQVVTKGNTPVNHIFNDPGVYTVTVTGTFAAGAPITESINVIIEPEGEDRSIVSNPPLPIVNQAATFTALNFYTPEHIRWDMGDGTILTSASRSSSASRFRSGISGFGAKGLRRRNRSGARAASVVTHTYTSPGTYQIRAYDFNGQATISVNFSVTVVLPPRSITFSPAQPLAGAPVQFTAVNFVSSLVDWNFGDGTVQNGGSVTASHVYANPGTYTVTARETDSNFPAVTIAVNVVLPNRQITYSPQSPRVDQLTYFQANNFITGSIDWNFGDGTIITGGSNMMTHRYQAAGSYTVTARDSTIQHPQVSALVTVLPENRQIIVSPPDVRTNQDVTVTAINFRGELVLWDFGDGTSRSGGYTEVHQYRRAGTYTITAQDENGESDVRIMAQVTVRGIDDTVNIEIAEIRLDNGKYYKVVPKNSKNIRAVLRMKMRGTGIVSGYWMVDGHAYEFFNEVVNQGELREIYTRRIPGLPVLEPGLHRITAVLTRPSEIPVTFPVLKYFVLAHENTMATTAPQDGFIAKENEIPSFSWEEPNGASKYQIAFSDFLYPLLNNSKWLKWYDTGTERGFTPGPNAWKNIKRNHWTYWKVRALDTMGNIVAESDIQDIKVVIATAKITIDKVTDLHGNVVSLTNGSSLSVQADDLMAHGSVQYMGDSKFLVLRVYVNEELTDQLLFRDVKKKEVRYFETSLPNKKQLSRVRFQVLKTSSPAVIVGIKGLILKR
jgi:PKD repeat protein